MASLKPIDSAPRDNKFRLFYSPGNETANVRGARQAKQTVDRFHPEQHPDAKFRWNEFPEAPYTHWRELPPDPKPSAQAEGKENG